MTQIKIRYSQFDTSALATELEKKYMLTPPLNCKFFKNGLNDVYKIRDGAGNKYFLRISLSGVHTLLDINEEISIILFLRKNGLQVVEPIKCIDSEYVWEISAPEGIRQTVLFREIQNYPSNNGINRYFNLGTLIAKMHIITDNMDIKISRSPIDKVQLSKRPLAIMKPYLAHRTGDYDFMSLTSEALYKFVTDTIPFEKPYYGFCHGDIQPGNYFFNGEQPILFDFDCLGLGYHAYDLGVLLANLSFSDNEIHEKPIWNAVIDGYNSIRPLTQNELSAIFAFAALHMMRVLAYHVEITEQNNGIFYYTSDPHLDLFVGAYKRLAELALVKCGIEL